MDHGVTGAARAIDTLGDPTAALLVFLGLLAASSAGAVAYIMTRTLAILAGIAAATILFLAFHLHLPLPWRSQADILLVILPGLKSEASP